MRAEIKFFVYAFVLGASLIMYAHATFSTKSMVNLMYDHLLRIELKIDRLLEANK